LNLFLLLSLSSCLSNQIEIGHENFTGSEAAIRQLSYYLPSLRNTPVDTYVYILDSGKPGASLLLVGGTHGNEIAGIRAAEIFIERAVIEAGRVYIIPRLNILGVAIESRLIPIEHLERMNPEIFIPPGGITQYPGTEQRNINRSYPGAEDEGFAQLIALAIMNLLYIEAIDIAIDLHEARPSSDLAWTLIAHQKNVEIAALAILDLSDEGINLSLDLSPPNDGFSHREWGNRTQASAFLIETANPLQDPNPHLYMEDPHYSLERRIEIQLRTINAIVRRANEIMPMPLYFSLPSFTE